MEHTRPIPENEAALKDQNPELVLNILVTEDNPGDILLIKEYLRESGINFFLTGSGTLKKSQALLAHERFDVILLDLGLPDSSGLETLKNLLSGNLATPVIVMTGLDDEETALASLREGAEDYIVKSRLDPEYIIRSIKYSIERKKLENLQKRNSHQLSVMSQTTAALHECDEIPPIFSVICKSIRDLTGKTITISIEVDKNNSFQIRNYEQLKLIEDKISSVAHFDMKNQVFRISDQNKDVVKRFTDGKIHYLKEGLYELLGARINRKKCSDLENAAKISHIYIIGILRDKNFYGGIIMFSEEELQEDDMRIIENLCSQTSVSIYRRIMKKNLIRSEARYQRLAEELEEKVRERTQELEEANINLNRELRERKLIEEALRHSEVQLKELNATKDKFFNIVAHDLKNPFTSLIGATEILYASIDNMDKEKIKRLAQILYDSAKGGYAILQNLLDWSRSQTGQIKIILQKLSLRKLIEDNIADLRLNSMEKQIHFFIEMNEDIQIITDKNMINTILRNLLSNASKFTFRGGDVAIRAEKSGNMAVVCIKDSGTGIPAENIDKLFRIDSKYTRPGTEKEGGTGLGLKLSKEFVEKLGGKIWASSVENKGSEFCFSLPLSELEN
jgi:signal transduction histidine kinase/DNA-binding NarL/FixJ family response regulator